MKEGKRMDSQIHPCKIDPQLQKDIDDLNTGRITYAEFQVRQYIRQKREFMPKLLDYAAAEKRKKLIDLALSVYEIMPEAFIFYDRIPDSLKYQFAIDAYIHHGDSIPAVRRDVRNAKRYGKPTLPEEIAEAETITIYRAGEEPIEKAHNRISWTTDYSVAEFFLREYIHRHATHLYMGTIKTKDIIAYCDDRNEKEVMQYRKVFEVTDITPE